MAPDRGIVLVTTRRARAVALLISVVTVVLIVAGIVFALLTSDTAADIGVEFVVRLLGIPFIVFGTLIVTRDPGNRVGWLFLYIACVFAFNDAALAYAEYAIPNRLAGREAAAWLAGWVWLLGIGGLGALVLWFPTGRAPSRRWVVVAWTGTIGMLIASASQSLWSKSIEGLAGYANPLGVGGAWGEVVETSLAVGTTMLFFSMLLSGVSMVVRFRRSRGEERQQLKAFAFAAAFLALSIFGTATTLRGNTASDPLPMFFQGLTVVAAIAIAFASGLAILRYRLYDIDVIINRALVYAVLTALLVAAYTALVFAFQELLSPFTAESDLAVAASTLAVAALFGPMRRRVQGFVDARFYRRKVDAQATVEEFSSRLRDEVDLEAVTTQLMGVVRDAIQPVHLSLWLRGSER
jgi:hypothetical protein